MDVGCWQGKEDEEPTMTFGLMVHNALALCSFYSNGNKLSTIPYVDSNLQFDFKNSLIYEFLRTMLINKYGSDFNHNLASDRYQNPEWAEYHIIKIIPFPHKALLADENTIHILIPDLHLHYFRDTYLDNFITCYENEYVLGKPVSRKLQIYKSMDSDFSTFLNTIIQFQQRRHIKSRVVFFGDLCEMWGTNAAIRHHCIHNIDLMSFYRGLEDLKNQVANVFTKIFEGHKILSEYATKLKQLKIDRLPIDPRFTAQLSILKKDRPLATKLAIDGKLSKQEIHEKARILESEILKKHHSHSGENFEDQLARIKGKVTIVGNHDNFHQISNMTPLFSFNLGAYDIRLGRFNPISLDNSPSSVLCYGHGHNLDPHNNDDYCGTGHLITIFLTFFEAKKQGHMLKRYDGAFRNTDMRSDNIGNICRIFHRWEQKDPRNSERNKIMILAHTHKPYLADISEEYNQYLSEQANGFTKITNGSENVMEWPRKENIGPVTIE